MRTIRSNTFNELSLSYYVAVMCMGSLGCITGYALLTPLNLNADLRLIISLIIGIIGTPLVLFVLFSSLLLLFIVVMLVFILFKKSTKQPKINNGFSIIEETLTKKFSATSVDLPIPEISRSALHVDEKDFSVSFTFNGMNFTWQQFKKITIIRTASPKTELPRLIIDSLINDTDAAQFDLKILRMRELDLGSDFGNYFSVHVPINSETNAYELLTPPLMIQSMALLYDMDVVMDSTYIEFISRTPQDIDSLMYRLAAIQDYVQILAAPAVASHSFILTAHRIRRSAQSITKVLDKYSVKLFIAFVVFVITLVTKVFTDKIYSVNIIWDSASSIILGLSIIGIIIPIVIVSYAFCISFVAGAVIGIYNRILTWKKKRTYADIRQKYWI